MLKRVPQNYCRSPYAVLFLKMVSPHVAYVIFSLAHKSNFAGHVSITTGLQRMHFQRPGIFLRWNSNLQQVDFGQGFAWNNILVLVALAVNDGLFPIISVIIHIFLCFSVYIFAI